MTKKRKGGKHVPSSAGGQRLKHRRLWRILVISVALAIIAAALGVGGWSYYNSQIKPYHQAAIKVNDITFNMRYYINTLEIYYGNVPAGALSEYTVYGDHEIEQFAGYVEQQIARNEIIRQGSLGLGVQIDRDVIKADLRKADLPVTDERIAILMAQELIKKQVPSAQPQAHVQAMLMPNESTAWEAKARLQAGETFDQVAYDLSKIPENKIYGGDMGWVTAREADITVGSTKFGAMISDVDANVLSKPLYDDTVSKMYGYWVAKVVEKHDATDNTSAEIHVKGILVGSEQEANEVIGELNAGTDIDELAKQVSQQPGAAENGAEIGWIDEGDYLGIFDVLFVLPPNEVSAPIGESLTETKGGYWIFNIVEKDDNRELTTEQEDLLVNDLVARCITALQKDPGYSVENLFTQEMRDFALNTCVLAQGEGSVMIRTGSLPDGEAGVSYSVQLEVYGNQQGNTWSITSGKLPQGLSLDSSTGLISGVPKFGGAASITIEVNNGLRYNTQDYVIHLHIPVSIKTESLPDGQVDVHYSAQIEILSDVQTNTWSIISGALPDGLTLGQYTGYISGTPATAGMSDFTVQVDDGFRKATKTLTITIQPASTG